MAAIALDNTLGAALIGLVVSATLTGVAISQAWYYYAHQNDRWPLRVLVGTVVVFDIVHQALITHTVYTYTITDFGDLAGLQKIVWSNSAEVIFTGLIGFLVQSFMAMRVWRFSNHNQPLAVAIALLVIGEFVVIMTSSAVSFRLKSYDDLKNVEYLPVLVNALAVGGDVLLTTSLCILLHRSRTGFYRSNTMINRLILFAINTGLITCIFAVASLITIVVAPHTMVFVAIFFCISKMYTNTLLATLNARQKIRNVEGSGVYNNTSFFLREFPASSTTSTGTRPPANRSIKIVATKEITRDDHPDDNRDSKRIETESPSVPEFEGKASVSPPLP